VAGWFRSKFNRYLCLLGIFASEILKNTRNTTGRLAFHPLNSVSEGELSTPLTALQGGGKLTPSRPAQGVISGGDFPPPGHHFIVSETRCFPRTVSAEINDVAMSWYDWLSAIHSRRFVNPFVKSISKETPFKRIQFSILTIRQMSRNVREVTMWYSEILTIWDDICPKPSPDRTVHRSVCSLRSWVSHWRHESTVCSTIHFRWHGVHLQNFR